MKYKFVNKKLFPACCSSLAFEESLAFYSQAINYYEAALKSGRKPVMRMRLAELLFQLECYEKCEKVLRQALDADQNPVGEFAFLLVVQKFELRKSIY